MNPRHQEIAGRLRYFFRESAGSMGLRSNFTAMVAGMEMGSWTPRQHYELDEHKIEAATRAREVLQVLEAIPVWSRVILSVAYRFPNGQELLLCATLLAVDYFKRSKTKRTIADWVERQRTSKDQKRQRLWVDMRQNTDAILEDALEEYERAEAELAVRRRKKRAARDTANGPAVA